MVNKIQRGLYAAENAILALLLTAMIVLAGAQILLRNVWDSGIAWGDPLLRLAVLWVGLIGAMVATRADQHIRIDLLTRYLPERFIPASRWLTEGFAAAVCALLAYHSARFVLLDWESETRAFASIPAWMCEAIIPIGFAVMALRFLLAPLSPTLR